MGVQAPPGVDPSSLRFARRRSCKHDAMNDAQNSAETAGPVVGRPFPKGVSGNPGGRPKGLPRYVRELVGDDGRRIADFMVSVLDDETERTETRMQAAQWLADRGFGRAHATASVELAVEERPQVHSLPTVTLADLLEEECRREEAA